MRESIENLLKQAVENFTRFNTELQDIEISRRANTSADQKIFPVFKDRYEEHKRQILDLRELLEFEAPEHRLHVELEFLTDELEAANAAELKELISRKERKLRIAARPFKGSDEASIYETWLNSLSNFAVKATLTLPEITAERHKQLIMRVFNSQKQNILAALNTEEGTSDLIECLNGLRIDGTGHNSESRAKSSKSAGGAKHSGGEAKGAAVQQGLDATLHLDLGQVEHMCRLLRLDTDNIIDKVAHEGAAAVKEISCYVSFIQALTARDESKKIIILKVNGITKFFAPDIAENNHYVALFFNDDGSVTYVDPTGAPISKELEAIFKVSFANGKEPKIKSSLHQLQYTAPKTDDNGQVLLMGGNDRDCGLLLPFILANYVSSGAAQEAIILTENQSVSLGQHLRAYYNQAMQQGLPVFGPLSLESKLSDALNIELDLRSGASAADGGGCSAAAAASSSASAAGVSGGRAAGVSAAAASEKAVSVALNAALDAAAAAYRKDVAAKTEQQAAVETLAKRARQVYATQQRRQAQQAYATAAAGNPLSALAVAAELVESTERAAGASGDGEGRGTKRKQKGNADERPSARPCSSAAAAASSSTSAVAAAAIDQLPHLPQIVARKTLRPLVGERATQQENNSIQQALLLRVFAGNGGGGRVAAAELAPAAAAAAATGQKTGIQR